jgi:hypothetical protein
MEDNIPNGIPSFDGRNFEYWKNRMETYLKSLGADVWFLVCFRIQCFEETKDCSSEGSKKEQQTGNRYHPGWIDRFSEIQGGIMCISKRDLGQATRPLCKGRSRRIRRRS